MPTLFIKLEIFKIIIKTIFSSFKFGDAPVGFKCTKKLLEGSKPGINKAPGSSVFTLTGTVATLVAGTVAAIVLNLCC